MNPSLAPASLRDWIDLPRERLREAIAAASLDDPASLLRSIRDEAGRFFQSDVATSRAIASRAIEIAGILGDPLSSGWAHRSMAEAWLFSGRMKEAEASYETAARFWRAAGARSLLGQLLVGRIHVLAMLGRYADAEATAEEARQHLTAEGDDTYLAKLAMNFGNIQFHRDHYGPALLEYERAGQAFHRLGLRDETVIGLDVNRGVALSQLDRDVEALDLFSRLEQECAARGYDLLLAQVRMNAAFVHANRGDYDLALRDLARAAPYFEETGHLSFLASCLLTRAEIYNKLNLAAEALDLSEQAARHFLGLGLRYFAALALSQGALASLVRREPARAIERGREARRLFLLEKNRPRAAFMELLWAEGLAQAGRRKASLVRAGAALSTFREMGLVRWEANAVVLLERLERKRRPPGERAARLRALLRRVPAPVYPATAYRVLEALGPAEEEAGRARAASTAYRRAVEQLESLRARVPTEDSKIAFLSDKAHLYDRLLSLELQAVRPSAARLFEWMERSRAQSLWDRLRVPAADPAESAAGAGATHATRDDDRRGAREREPGLRRQLAWLHARLGRIELGSPEERAHIPEIRERLAAAERAWSQALRERQEAESRRTIDALGIRPSAAPSLDEVRSRLPEGWGFLSFHVGPRFSIALALTDRTVRWTLLRPDLRRRLAALADRLDFQWGAAAMTHVRQAGATRPAPGPRESPSTALAGGAALLPPSGRPDAGRLHASTDAILEEIGRLLWQPLAAIGVDSSRRWVVSPHGPIHRVPIHAMRPDGRYLAESTDLCLVPSARVWLRLPGARTPAADAERRAWVAGVPSSQLPGVEREVERVGSVLSGWTVHADLAPTRESLRANGAESALVHLAAHGSLRSDNPAYSFIELADGPLFVHDLAGFRFPSSVVVLTACSSGRGAAPAGDEWIGLARGFLQAGAASVVASLWPIEDEPTLELIELFHVAHRSGHPVPAALGLAMRETMRLRPHPWHWASFAALGGV